LEGPAFRRLALLPLFATQQPRVLTPDGPSAARTRGRATVARLRLLEGLEDDLLLLGGDPTPRIDDRERNHVLHLPQHIPLEGFAGAYGANIQSNMPLVGELQAIRNQILEHLDRKSTRLNSSHVKISYAVFCLKKKNLQT